LGDGRRVSALQISEHDPTFRDAIIDSVPQPKHDETISKKPRGTISLKASSEARTDSAINHRKRWISIVRDDALFETSISRRIIGWL
jgi:hypothetical protein